MTGVTHLSAMQSVTEQSNQLTKNIDIATTTGAPIKYM